MRRPARSPHLLFVTALLAAGGGCANVVVETNGSSGSGGSSTSVSTGGETATGGTTTTSTGGSTGVGGATGGGGSEAQSILEACVIADACAGAPTGWPPFNASTCVDRFAKLGWWFDSPAWLPDPVATSLLRKCAASAKSDCDSFRACFGGDWIDLSRCREGAGCQGNSLFSAPDGPSLDCGALGGTCMELWSNGLRACCNAKPCAGTGDFTCEMGVASYCGGWGERVDFDCGVNGQTCNFDGQAPCKGVSSCDPVDSSATCQGPVAIYCVGGGLTTHDCGATGFRTACNSGAPPYENPCRPAHDDCHPDSYVQTCSGASLLACVDGAIVGVDCQGLGFSGCQQTMNSARCQ